MFSVKIGHKKLVENRPLNDRPRIISSDSLDFLSNLRKKEGPNT